MHRRRDLPSVVGAAVILQRLKVILRIASSQRAHTHTHTEKVHLRALSICNKLDWVIQTMKFYEVFSPSSAMQPALLLFGSEKQKENIAIEWKKEASTIDCSVEETRSIWIYATTRAKKIE